MLILLIAAYTVASENINLLHILCVVEYLDLNS